MKEILRKDLISVTAPDLIHVYGERKQDREQTDIKHAQFGEEKNKFKGTNKTVQKQL